MRLPKRLWWLRWNTFQSDEHSAVVDVDIFHVRYREGDRSMLISVEPAAVSHLLFVDYESMQSWEPPHEDEALSEQDRGRIIDNMRRAFATRHYEMDLMNGPRVFAHATKLSGGEEASRDVHRR